MNAINTWVDDTSIEDGIKIEKLKAENAELRECLKFYARPEFWGRNVSKNEYDSQHFIPIDIDPETMKCGWRACQAITKHPNQPSMKPIKVNRTNKSQPA